MSVFTNIKRSAHKGVIVGALVATVLGVGVLANPGHAAAGDCDSNAVIRCGVQTTAEINNKYDASPQHP